ncbi:MAG: hypothetical protein V8T31_03515 [Lachnospiraceae bacterium]
MADKRTDKDDNVKEDRSWQFIQEKIVRQPLSRRQIIRYIILTVICAVLFGTISAVCFTVTKTVAKKIMGQEKAEESRPITIPKDEPETQTPGTCAGSFYRAYRAGRRKSPFRIREISLFSGRSE